MDKILIKRIVWSIVVIVITLIILTVIKKYLIKKIAYTTKEAQKANTFLGVLFNVLQYLVVLIAAIVILKINGINITALLAGLGIVATIVGLALQDTLKDVIAGINIYNNNFYKVGDIVIYNDKKCEVKYFSARVTKFKDVYTDSTYTVNNSCITSIEKVKEITNIIINFDMSDDKKKIDKAFNNAVKRTKEIPEVIDSEYFGIFSINDSGVGYAMCFKTKPRNVYTGTKVYQILYEELAKMKIAPNTADSVKIKNDPWDN